MSAHRNEVRIDAGEKSLTLDCQSGTYTIQIGGVSVVWNAHAEAKADGQILSSRAFVSHSVTQEGDRVLFLHQNHPMFGGEMRQIFHLEEERPYLLTDVIVSHPDGVSTNRLSPLTVGAGGMAVDHGVFVQIPFDNDMWVEPALLDLQGTDLTVTSYEVGALYDAATDCGLVVGSVTHDVWKTGITIAARQGAVTDFAAYGGVADTLTRDHDPHGMLSGTDVRSPLLFVGFFTDWRDGMMAYGEANARMIPPKESVTDVPFGYNSWGVLQSKVGYGDMIATSDYIRAHLQEAWSADGAPVYVNIDSFWDFITHNDKDCALTTEEALRSFAAHCHENGQKAGIYFTPFAAWHGDEAALRDSRIIGTTYTYYDAALKLAGGRLYGKLDGGFALDPTHPGTIHRFTEQLNAFVDMGFDYVKLDFMTHGALEGRYYDAGVTTGMQAYNAGMRRILALCQGKMLVNLSIAPLFPYRYADGRRISCDAFSSLDNTRHVLSYLTACFWVGTIYPYPDPDHLVVWGKDGDVTDGEARCRVTVGAIAGTSFLMGDNLADIVPGSQKEARILSLFGNRDILATAKLGRMFQPWKVTPGVRCADIFRCIDGDDIYLAVFRFTDDVGTFSLDLADILPKGRSYTARELWRETEVAMTGTILPVSVPGRDVALYKITADPVYCGMI